MRDLPVNVFGVEKERKKSFELPENKIKSSFSTHDGFSCVFHSTSFSVVCSGRQVWKEIDNTIKMSLSVAAEDSCTIRLNVSVIFTSLCGCVLFLAYLSNV